MPRQIKSVTDVRAEAKKSTELSLRTLRAVAASPKSPAAARVAAATALLDRGWGKPKQPLTGDDDGPPIAVIERVIVEAPN